MDGELGGSMLFSVIITTYNRVDLAPRAIDSVLTQQGVEFELIIVDDGSTDGTASYIGNIPDSRVRAVVRDNGGLGAARNTGIALASGDWIAFLDDDDVALPGWLNGFASLIDNGTGIVCCGAEYVTPSGTAIDTFSPAQMGPRFRQQVGLMIAGAFAVRHDLLQAVNGYDERITCSHQTELGMRLVPEALDRGLALRHTDKVLLRVESREPQDRPMSNPDALYRGISLLVEKHKESFGSDSRGRAAYNGILGVSAIRLERWRYGRSALFSSARAEPFNVHRWLRLAVALFPPLARRVWRVEMYQADTLEVAR